MKTNIKSKFLASTALVAAISSSPVFADRPARAIEAKAGKTVCYREAMTVGSDTSESRLCVTQASFQNDLYVFVFNNQPIIRAIDDQTTQGVSGIYKSTQFSMTCAPQHTSPTDVTQEKLDAYQKLLPKLTPEQVRQDYMKVNTVETGRLCDIRANGEPFYSVQVRFE